MKVRVVFFCDFFVRAPPLFETRLYHRLTKIRRTATRTPNLEVKVINDSYT